MAAHRVILRRCEPSARSTTVDLRRFDPALRPSGGVCHKSAHKLSGRHWRKVVKSANLYP